MDNASSKRRKTSPTTSVPVDAPTTPSHIPARNTQHLSGGERYPSFASPTKASLSRHHPQLVKRPSSAGVGAERPRSRGRDIQDMFAKALGEPGPSIEGNETPLVSGLGSATPRGSGHRRARSDGGGLSAKPRRMSRSPSKQASKPIEAIELEQGAVEEQENIANPFVKRGLRRSPPVGSQTGGVLQALEEPNINPFEKRGLRRSPVSSQAVEAAGEILGQTKALPEVLISTTDLLPSKAAEAPVVSRSSEPREEDHEKEIVTQSTEPITLNSFEQRKEAEWNQQATDGPPSSESAQPIVLSNPQRTREQHLEESSRKPRRSSQAAEPVTVNRPQREEPKLHTKASEQPHVSESDQPIIIPNLERQRERHLAGSSRRNPLSSQAAESVTFNRRQPEEPELPPTPTQRGIPDPIVTTPPTGIHDTPSKRAKSRSAKIKSSPLKPQGPAAPARPKTAEPDLQPKSKKPQSDRRRRSSRFLIPEDPHAAKKKIRDDLLKELQQLQADVALGNQENERLRLQYESKKHRPTAPSNPDELLDMLLRATRPESVAEQKKPTSIFKSIDSFLPFSSRRKRQRTALPALDKPIPSHLPIALDDPLPYLQVFSPLTYTSVITLLPPEATSPGTSVHEPEQPILQRHLIKASHPSGLFTARLSMTVDSSLFSITSLDVEALPSSAEKELGTFMREGSNPDSVLSRDIGVVCWAMGRWVEMSVSRARLWCAVEQAFGTPEARAKSLQRKIRKRKRRPSVVLDDDYEDGNDEQTNRKWTMRQLLPHMGQTAMELSNGEVELRFEWTIGFNWTGEVENAISASARLPKCCKYSCYGFLSLAVTNL